MRIPDFKAGFGYSHPDQGDDPGPDPFVEADFLLTRQIAEVIERHYFGQPFQVVVSHRDGIVKINIPALMGSIHWYVVHIAQLHSDPQMKSIVRGCGDILERFNIPRTAYDREEYIAAVQSVPILLRVSGRGYVPN
jgi:hypothetical protein